MAPCLFLMFAWPAVTRSWTWILCNVFACVAIACVSTVPVAAADQGETFPASLRQNFVTTVKPFLDKHCLSCHGADRQEAKLDLSPYQTIAAIVSGHQTWEIVLERLEAGEMPPADAERIPDAKQREAVVTWIRAVRQHAAEQNAGDPGVVLARRLSNAEYNHSIRDVTGIDIRPTRSFPVDPANTAGFDNSGESLAVSPALLNKYLAAAREVASHAVMTPEELVFAPHPAVTDTDRDKYCVKRIVEFYRRQPTDLATYFFVCWQYAQDAANSAATDAERAKGLGALARAANVSEKYTMRVWELLHEAEAWGPTARLQAMFRELPGGDAGQAQAACQQMRDYARQVRGKLAPNFPNLYVEGSHKGSQPFVLWKNRQYASHRQTFDREALAVAEAAPEGLPEELTLAETEDEQARQLAAISRFCATIPDQFYVAERGRDYLDVPREKQEKGRLLSAGFHSMLGYFRDDTPLCDLILTDTARQELDRLWQDLDYVASAPQRQYAGFLWFERTDSRYMRDPEFDFARAEDKSAIGESMIRKLSQVYLDKARRSDASPTAVQAIEFFFDDMNRQVRKMESLRSKAEQRHREALLRLAERAWRRHLREDEKQGLDAFYDRLRHDERLQHEAAIRDCIVFIFMSPHFLLRVDLGSAGEGYRELTPVELASRLSYFLWASTPDAEQLRWADAREAVARDHEAVFTCAESMLRDDRVRGLATEFATHWLGVRRFEEHNSVDRQRFPQFDDALRKAMFEEPVRFFVDLVQHDRSVLELLYADHTWVNAVLAKHYGVSDLEFRDDAQWLRLEDATQVGRGGLLPMSVFLTKNAPGLRTSPVKRGYWVVRQLLGERIPPPPPNVPELPADESQLGELSLRAMLARHREHSSCAGCHDRFDTIGLAFEGYGPIGERRAKDLGGRPVDTQATFPDGSRGSGVDGLLVYLRTQRQQDFVDNLCRKLLSFAIGRTLVLSDEPLIAKMKSELVAADYRFSSLVRSIVTSRQFLTKRGDAQLVKGSQ
ncbi:MAG: hypothetical protein CL681_15805 [Blastopirellula sp.]|nr:hypothetical protein [Blastopirellula sp.]